MEDARAMASPINESREGSNGDNSRGVRSSRRFLNEKTLLRGKTLPGLVILRMITEQYYASTRGESMYRLNELQSVHRKGDRIEDFQITWRMVLDGQG